jgi:Gpi18-like mannosyltransferase
MIFIFIPGSAFAAANLATNPGFEENQGIAGWSEYIWDQNEGVSRIVMDNAVMHSGKASICIINNSPNDSRAQQQIKVSGNRFYKLSCWIKTENVGLDAKGANLSIEGLINTSKDIQATAGWEQVEIYGKTGDRQTSFVLTLGVGGYNSLNQGRAWFDDVLVEEVDSIPSDKEVIQLFREDVPSAVSSGEASSDTAKAVKYNVSMLIYFTAFMLVFAILSYYCTKKNVSLSKRNERIIILAILSSALLLRIIFAQVIEGWPNDISTNKAWAVAAAKGLTTFYSTIWCDYPPVLIYIFALVGKLASIPALAPQFTLLIKLPAILADIATSFLIYKVAAKQLKPALALTAAAAIAFHPAAFLDSTIWGQVDSIFTFLIISALILLVDRKLEASAVLFTVAALMKPQAVFFLPVMLFELIKRRKVSKFVSVILYAFVTTVIVILPFAIGKEPLWIFRLYLDTGKEYPYAAMNPFNIFTLSGGNFTDGSLTSFIFSYNTWGILFDVIIFGIAGYIHLKSRHTAAPIVVAALLNAGAFTFSVKMHERYLFPVIALLLLAFIYIKDKRVILLFAGFSATVFFNIHLLFYRMLKFDITGSYFSWDSSYVVLFSMMNIFLFVYLVKTARNILIDDISVKIKKSRRKEVHSK